MFASSRSKRSSLPPLDDDVMLKKMGSRSATQVVFKPDRLTFVVAPSSRPPRLHLTNCHYFCVDGDYHYQNFCNDFGPLNLAMLFKFCQRMNAKLTHSNLEKKNIVLYTNGKDVLGKANAAYLIGAYAVLYLHIEPSAVSEILRPAGPFHPFRDASTGPSVFDLRIDDCLRAVKEAARYRWLDFSTFDVQEYETYETVENGDFNWIVPGRFLAFCGPHSKTVKAHEGYPTHTPESYHAYFKSHNITDIVRTNKAIYDSHRFSSHGFRFHDLFFVDGTTPTREIVLQFIALCNEALDNDGGIAIHCKAGLGRTGTLIACFLMKEYFLTASVAIAWIRICRPGSILGQQQIFLKVHEQWLWSIGKKENNERSNKEMASIQKKVDTIALSELSDVFSSSSPGTVSTEAKPCSMLSPVASVDRKLGPLCRDRPFPLGRERSPFPTSVPALKSKSIDVPRDPMTILSSAPLSIRRSQRASPADPCSFRLPVPAYGSRGELPPSPVESPPGEPMPRPFDVYQPDLGLSEVKTQGDYLREMKTASQRQSTGGSKVSSPVVRPSPSASRTGPGTQQPVPRIGSTLAECQKLQMEMQTQRGQSSRVTPGKRPRVVNDVASSDKSWLMPEPLTSRAGTTPLSAGTVRSSSYKLRSSTRRSY